MNYKSFNLGDWIGLISGAIEDERELDGNEMRDLVEFLSTLKQEPILDKIRAEIENYCGMIKENHCKYCSYCTRTIGVREILEIIDKYKESENK